MSAASQSADFDGHLIAMAVRVLESERGDPFDDAAADELARRDTGDFEQRLVVRARALEVARLLRAALDKLRATLRLAVAFALLVAAAGGVATAHTALTADDPVNFPWALLALLGVHLIALALWLLVLLFARGAVAPTSLGGMVAAAARRFAARSDEAGPAAVMMRTAGAVMARGAIGRWSLSAISHGLWLAFMAGAIAMTLLILSTRQVSFTWQTTILSADSYVPATEAIAVLPRLAGFATPDTAQIRAGRWTGQGTPPIADAEAWSGLLLGALVLYGAVPRLLLLVLCWALRGAAVGRFRLDLGLPGFLRLRERLMPTVRREGVVDPDDGDDEVAPAAIEAVPVARVDGPVAAVALELDPDGGWPPEVPGVQWLDLGTLDGREDRERAAARLRTDVHCLVLAAVSLLTTPDRGVAAVLRQLTEASGRPLALVLADAARLRARHDDAAVAQRLEDWRALGVRVGVPPEWSLEVDLETDDAAGRARLARLLGGEGA